MVSRRLSSTMIHQIIQKFWRVGLPFNCYRGEFTRVRDYLAHLLRYIFGLGILNHRVLVRHSLVKFVPWGNI